MHWIPGISWLSWEAVGLLAGGLAFLFFVLPLMLRRACAKAGSPQVGWSARFAGGLGTSILIGGIVLTALVAVFAAGAVDEAAACFGTVALGLLVVGAVSFSRTVLKWTRRWASILLLLGAGAIPPAAIGVSWMATLNRMRFVAKRVADAANLNGIGKGMVLYQDRYGLYPTDLRVLVDTGYASGKILISIYSGTRLSNFPSSRPYNGPVDYVLIPLPERRPDSLVWVWANPSWYGWEGTNVLYADCEVRWVPPERFLDELGRTWQWLVDQPRPASRPATAASE